MRIIRFSILVCCLIQFAFAQGVYLNGGLGYAIPIGGQALGTDLLVTESGEFTEKNITGTFGSGIPVKLTGGIMTGKHLGFELSGSFFRGTQLRTGHAVVEGALGAENERQGKASVLSVCPSIVVKTESEDAINFYGRAGFIIPLWSQLVSTSLLKEDVSGDSQFDNEVFSKTVTRGGVALGVAGGVGITLPVSDKLGLFFELEGVQLKVPVSSSEMTVYTRNDIDELGSLTVSDKEVNFVKQLNQNSNIQSNPDFSTDRPLESLVWRYDTGYLGINLGFSVFL